MAQRYCTNCGAELREEDRFCPNCGSPTHETAAISTPEADVPVPPPPLQGEGTAASSPQGQGTPATEWWQTSMGKTLGILAAIIAVLAILASLAGGEETSSPADKPKKQQEGKKALEQGSGGELEATIKPKLVVSSPSKSTTVTTSSIDVEGKVTPPDSDVTVNGQTITPYDDKGSFKQLYILDMGENEIKITATNGSKQVEYSRVVTRKLSEEEIAAKKAEEKKAAEQKAAEEKAADEDQVRAAAESYYQAAAARDWGYTYSHLDSETQSAFTEDEWFAKNDWLADTGSASYTIQSVDMDSSSQEPVANVTVLLTFQDGSTSTRYTYFVFEDGSWKHRFSSEEYDLLATAQTGTQQQEQEPEQPKPDFSDGTYQVGTDIQPGTYRTREGSSGCYYARLSGFSNEIEDILANGVTDAPAIVTIKPTDAGFESQGCGTWTQDLSAITGSKTSFDAGSYIVGTDIEPGTYRNSGSSGCYYERLSGFTGDMNSIIANGVTDAPAVVTIAPTDAGFQSQDCGTWTTLE